MEAVDRSSTSSTYSTVTVGGSANAQLGNTHNEGTTITVQQYVFVFGHPSSNCVPAPTPSTASTTNPLYSTPRPERPALRPSLRAPLGTTSHVHKKRSPTTQHPGYILPTQDVARHYQHQPPTRSRSRSRSRRRRPLSNQRTNDRAAGSSHSSEPG